MEDYNGLPDVDKVKHNVGMAVLLAVNNMVKAKQVLRLEEIAKVHVPSLTAIMQKTLESIQSDQGTEK